MFLDILSNIHQFTLYKESRNFGSLDLMKPLWHAKIQDIQGRTYLLLCDLAKE